ncbi:MAG: hypothetical protein GXP24_10550 [Planctomycetes bacterium]|nr:hypothetical protein [Planctomycetota bacterium]
MTSNSPHYLLFSEASRDRCSLPTWRFVLQNVESQRRFAATDSEPCDCGERLELLAVVRGLEALDGPARVTLVTKSRYVSRGIKKGLAEWRANDWKWERFGRIVPVRDHDLWRRVDRALQFHTITCQAWQFETVEVEPTSLNEMGVPAEIPVVTRRTRRRRVDPPHVERLPRVVHPVQRLKRRKTQAAHLTAALRNVTRPMREAVGAAT